MGIERIPKGKFTREFREEAVRMVVEDKQSVAEVSRRLQLPEQTTRNWVKAYKEGKLGEIGKGQKEMSSLERELYETKRELARVKMERDILGKRPRTLPGSRCPVRDDRATAAPLFSPYAVRSAFSIGERLLRMVHT